MPNDKLSIPRIELNVDTPNRCEILKKGLTRSNKKENILGRGTFGTVLKAIYKGKQVAVKILNSSTKMRKLTIENESNILGWQHKNIISILKIDSASKYSAIIMERFPGHCLQYILDKIEISLRHRICISLDILSGLNYCHKNGLLHLDIKPKNILVAFVKNASKINHDFKENLSYICKICDFGSSMKLNKRIPENQSQATVRYMSPESLKNEMLTEKTDIYSLGVTMWQLKTGQTPYSSIDCNETVAYKVIKENYRPDLDTSSSMRMQFSSDCHKECFCEFVSCDLVINSLECIDNFLKNHNSKNELQSNFRKKRKALFQDSNKLSNEQRSPFKVKNQNNLICEKVPIKIIGEIEENQNEFDLKIIFNDCLKKQFLAFEMQYKKLYKLCWNSDPFERPSSVVLSNEFNFILNQFA